MTREELLNKAKECVCGQRKDDYGKVERNFGVIADLWNVYLNPDVPIEPYDVAVMMALLKIARIKTGTGTDDSWVDLAGYAACGGELNSTRNRAMGRFKWYDDKMSKEEAQAFFGVENTESKATLTDPLAVATVMSSVKADGLDR